MMSFAVTIHCDYPLPDPEYQREVFGAPDLDPHRGHYCITADGRLVWQKLEQPFAAVPGDDMKVLDSEDVDFHGEFYFQSLLLEEPVVYRAYFRQGTLYQVVRENLAKQRNPNPWELLAWEAEDIERERVFQHRWQLRKLMELEPEIARRIRSSERNRTAIAFWFATPNLELDRLTPYRAIALEKREAVLELLDKELKRP